MSVQAQTTQETPELLPSYASLLLAVDSSDHANRGILEAVELAKLFGSRLTATHVYAAKLHDIRFRQMEGGLPEQFREEQELERQRDVHDDLITRGLSIITDSYLDQVERAAHPHKIGVTRRSLEGKNYRELVKEAGSGNYDLLVMGALGLGAVKGSRLGTVCQRVSRRSPIDTLIIKDPNQSLKIGPIVVGVDGSAKAYGGLLTALSLAKAWGCEVKVVSAFDPYYHYVAFNRIAGVLSEEAGQVFKFKEQEQLHEEIIDSGLAKIYQGHLTVAQSIAQDQGMEVETILLDGKPHEVINRYLHEVKPSLLILGTTGIHADSELDIGGNTEYLLNDAECAVLLSQHEHQPQVDRLASITTSWTHEAEARMERVPSFVRSMARMAILRYAQEKGHTVITESIVEEATAQLMPGHAEQAMGEIVEAYDRGELKPKPDPMVIRWSEEATQLLLTVKDLSLRGNLSMRAEKKARTAGAEQVEAEHIRSFINPQPVSGAAHPKTASTASNTPLPPLDEAGAAPPSTGSKAMHWQAAALARLMRVPEGFMRDSSKQRIEAYARDNSHAEISLAIAEAGLAEARKAMEQAMQGEQNQSTSNTGACPFAGMVNTGESTAPTKTENTTWHTEAKLALNNVPPGFCRDMTRKAAETIAKQNGQAEIDEAFVQHVMQTFQAGSENSEEGMPWEQSARERIAKAPDMVRGMLIKEIEGWSRRKGLTEVSGEAVDAVKQTWAERGVFHLAPHDPRNGSA
ncbi:MAG: universal stress protein [Chromatiales bacterium]|nr:universal stress protein [Chromatiales bacterium]